MQGYATTETTAVATLMDPYDINYGRTGSPLFGAQVRLIDWDEGGYHPTDKPRPRGEIVVGGDAVTAGYFKLDSQTEEVYRNENGVRWFYTGDIGEFYPDGTLKIIDRKKDLLKLQHGEYVSLGKVEAELKTSKLVDNICCYGDSFSTHLVALVIPNEHAVRALAARLGLDSGAKWPTLCKDKRLVEEVTQLVMQHGRKAALHKTEIPTRLKLCTEEWTPDSGLATAALKIRRKPLQTFYQSDIDAMYGKVTDTLDANRNLVS
ncbi:Long-chain-fatty-acid--CoA ligase 3 [Halotydeus destructor]|nr:Long-chain-fatty-acid--CoA ligase 3 [Halotydeus destructor]